MTTLKQDSRVEAALRRLRQMGFTVSVMAQGEERCFVFITLDSFAKMVERLIKMPNKKVNIESGFIVVEIWREK